jgi:hypothetical protein
VQADDAGDLRPEVPTEENRAPDLVSVVAISHGRRVLVQTGQEVPDVVEQGRNHEGVRRRACAAVWSACAVCETRSHE